MNDEASRKIAAIVSTLSTVQPPSGRLNNSWPRNIACIHLTLEVFHALMSSLKDAVDKTQWSAHDWPSIQSRRTPNRHPMYVTPPVSHVEMWPYVASAAVAFESHAATAVRMLVSSMT